MTYDPVMADLARHEREEEAWIRWWELPVAKREGILLAQRTGRGDLAGRGRPVTVLAYMDAREAYETMAQMDREYEAYCERMGVDR